MPARGRARGLGVAGSAGAGHGRRERSAARRDAAGPAEWRGRRDEQPDRGRRASRRPTAASRRCRLCDLRGPRGRDQRADRPQRLGQDDAVQRHHRLRAHPAGRRSASSGTEITNAPPDRVFALGIGRTFQLTRMFAAPDRAREHARRHAAPGGLAARRAAPAPARPARSAGRSSCSTSSASPAWPTSRPATSPTVSASCSSWPRCWSPTRHPAARRAGRRRQPDAHQPPRRPHPRSQPRRQDDPRRRAQHGVRDEPVLADHRAAPGHGAGLRARPRRCAPTRRVLDAYLGGEDDAATQQELAQEAVAFRRPLSVTPVRHDRAKLGESLSAAEPARRDRRLRRRRHPQGRHARRAARRASPASSGPTAPASRR